MSYVRKRNLFKPDSEKPFKLSRTRLESFLECPRCFYLDRRLGIEPPEGYAFSLNIAVDHLLKKEFDIHRAAGTQHPLMKTYGIDAIPFAHDDLDTWRMNFKGVEYLHEPTNLIITGAVDDIWVNPDGQLIVVDYKATSTEDPDRMKENCRTFYARQMTIYQWLLRRKGFRVADTGYFVYVNGQKDRKAFDGKLEFDVHLIPCTCDDSWVEETILRAHECLVSDVLPPTTATCEYCAYRAAAEQVESPVQLRVDLTLPLPNAQIPE